MPLIIKYFFLLQCSLYCYHKILNIKHSKYDFLHQLFFSIVLTPIVIGIRSQASYLTLFSIVFLLEVYARIKYKVEFDLNFCSAILSCALSYTALIFSAILLSPFSFIPIFRIGHFPVLITLAHLTVCIFQMVCVIIIFRTRRFQNGIPNFLNHFAGNIGVHVGIAIMLVATLICTDGTSKRFSVLLLFTLILLGIFLFVWWQKYLLGEYIQRATNRNFEIMEQTIEKQKIEIEQLSKIIHKDNKLISALKLSVNEQKKNPKDFTSDNILLELEILTEERTEFLKSYEKSSILPAQTGIFPVDIIISSLYNKSVKNNINFDISIVGNIGFMAENVADKHDLSTLIADLGENAIIAVSMATTRNILLLLGVKDCSFHIDFFDSGIPFCGEVINKLGEKRYTTRRNQGGSGIGLMTTLELAKKYSASFEIEELYDTEMYCKRVSIIFDRLSQIRIYSSREEIIKECLKRTGKIILNRQKCRIP